MDKNRHLLLKARPAVKSDFSTDDGKKITDVIYIQMLDNGCLDKKLYLFNDKTNLQIFKTLYSQNRIYVFDQDAIVNESNCEY